MCVKCFERNKWWRSDWRCVAFLQTLVALKKLVGVGIGKSEKNPLRCVENGMSGKQRYSKCSRWPPSAWILFPVIFAPDQLHRQPPSAKIQPMSQDASATRPYRALVLDTCEKMCEIRVKMKKMKNVCILQSSAVTFFSVVGKGVTVCFLLR